MNNIFLLREHSLLLHTKTLIMKRIINWFVKGFSYAGVFYTLKIENDNENVPHEIKYIYHLYYFLWIPYRRNFDLAITEDELQQSANKLNLSIITWKQT